MGSFKANASPIILTDLEVDGGTVSVDATNDRVGIGVTDPDTKLEVLHNGTQLKLSFDGSKYLTLAADTNGYGTLATSGGFLSVDILSFKRYIKSTLADGTTLAATDSGAIILQSTNGATITLPAASLALTGIQYTFVLIGAAGTTFNISPNASDAIAGSILDVANGNIVTASNDGGGTDNKDLQLDSGSKTGDRVTLVCNGSTGWTILDALGSWTFE